nr:hypothetical protein GCM10010200_000960 [Actinomadura rugatobispora]
MNALGVRPGDRVAACLPNDLPIVVAFHASQRIGAIWVGVAEAYPAAEQDELVALSDPAVVLAGEKWKGGHPGAVDSARWARLAAAGHQAPALTVDPFAPAAIAFTSGTTGTPKGIVHSRHNLVLPGARGRPTASRRGGPRRRGCAAARRRRGRDHHRGRLHRAVGRALAPGYRATRNRPCTTSPTPPGCASSRRPPTATSRWPATVCCSSATG